MSFQSWLLKLGRQTQGVLCCLFVCLIPLRVCTVYVVKYVNLPVHVCMEACFFLCVHEYVLCACVCSAWRLKVSARHLPPLHCTLAEPGACHFCQSLGPTGFHPFSAGLPGSHYPPQLSYRRLNSVPVLELCPLSHPAQPARIFSKFHSKNCPNSSYSCPSLLLRRHGLELVFNAR